MKVSIAYTADLESIPSELQKLLSDKTSDVSGLKEAFEKLDGYIKEGKYDLALEEMGVFRAELVRLDFRLGDCMSILSGFLKQKYSPEPAPAPPTPTPAKDAPPADPRSVYKTPGNPQETLAKLASLRKTNPELFPSSKKGEKDDG